jgi:transcriptional regulator with XRE-family HTH domain
MPSSSSVQRARQALADRLREVRLDAGLTARALSSAAGWHEAKTSRIEHARTAPSDTDIRTWCEICDAVGQMPDLIAASRAADSMWTEWRRLERPGLRRAQEAVVPLWERTRQFRIYSPCLIPGPVQTADYIQALLRAIRERRPNRIDDIEDAVRVRIAKQHVTYEADRRFTILLEENALRHRIGGPDILRDQLRHLLAAASMPSVMLGIIPFLTDRSPLRPVEMFFLFDDAEVSVELVSGWLRIREPTEVAMYADAFAKLAAMAVYGKNARGLIAAAVDALE